MDEKREVILQIRVSPHWLEGGKEVTERLVMFLYGIYTFLGFDNPMADFGWAVGTDKVTGSTYLILFEYMPEFDVQIIDGSKPDFQQTDDNGPDLGDEDLIPDL